MFQQYVQLYAEGLGKSRIGGRSFAALVDFEVTTSVLDSNRF